MRRVSTIPQYRDLEARSHFSVLGLSLDKEIILISLFTRCIQPFGELDLLSAPVRRRVPGTADGADALMSP